jgi:oligopeptide transport system permease protein
MPSFVVATILLYVFSVKLGVIQAFSAGENLVFLPVLALCLSPLAYITRLTKTSMLDALGQDYIRTAKAKGVSSRKVIFVHGLRNALIPVITYVGPMVASILTGSMVVEAIFNLGGLGSKFVSAITNRDYTLIMATTIFLATVMVIANLITDIVYKIVDPRIKLD